MFVLTLSPREASEQEASKLLNEISALPALVPFRRSRGHDLIGVLGQAEQAVAVALTAMRHRTKTRPHFSVGIGIGAWSTDSDGLLTGTGPSRALRAVEDASKLPTPVCVEAGPEGFTLEGLPSAPSSAAAAQAVLRLLADIVGSRTPAEWAVLDLLVPGVRGQQREAAAALGISVQAVSQAVSRAQRARECEARPAAALLLQLAAQAVE